MKGKCILCQQTKEGRNEIIGVDDAKDECYSEFVCEDCKHAEIDRGWLENEATEIIDTVAEHTIPIDVCIGCEANATTEIEDYPALKKEVQKQLAELVITAVSKAKPSD